MSFKTDRLVELFPDAYAASEKESTLYKLLDTIAAEFMSADEAVKNLLKSHWVDYASGKALDGLAAIYSINRRRLEDGSSEEPDNAFRLRLKSVVPLFTGGGTRRAVIGAVRSALGLPFDLERANLPVNLRNDLEQLIYIEEFSPVGERVLGQSVLEVDDDETTLSPCHEDATNEVRIIIDIPGVSGQLPAIRWRFTRGVARCLTLELLPDEDGEATLGLRSSPQLVIDPAVDDTLTLSTRDDGSFSALLGLTDVSHLFTGLDGITPPAVPQVPVSRSDWRFRAQSAMFDTALFDTDTFDQPLFEVEMNWLRYQPLTFDVLVPYHFKKVVENLAASHGYSGPLFVFEGLPIDTVAEVVDQTRAAGVRASVQFTLNFLRQHDHDQGEHFHIDGEYDVPGKDIAEDAGAFEYLMASSVNDIYELHDTGEAFAIGGVFDVSTFDGNYGFAP